MKRIKDKPWHGDLIGTAASVEEHRRRFATNRVHKHPFCGRYDEYVRYHSTIAPGTPALPFEQWDALKPFWDEDRQFKADVFLASLHPDGGNLAGFKGMSQNEEHDA